MRGRAPPPMGGIEPSLFLALTNEAGHQSMKHQWPSIRRCNSSVARRVSGGGRQGGGRLKSHK